MSLAYDHPALTAAYITERIELLEIGLAALDASEEDRTQARAAFRAEMLLRQRDRALLEHRQEIRRHLRGLQKLLTIEAALEALAMRELPDHVWGAADTLDYIREGVETKGRTITVGEALRRMADHLGAMGAAPDEEG